MRFIQLPTLEAQYVSGNRDAGARCSVSIAGHGYLKELSKQLFRSLAPNSFETRDNPLMVDRVCSSLATSTGVTDEQIRLL